MEGKTETGFQKMPAAHPFSIRMPTSTASLRDIDRLESEGVAYFQTSIHASKSSSSYAHRVFLHFLHFPALLFPPPLLSPLLHIP